MIELRYHGASMTIDEKGAELRAWHNGRERLWSGDPAVWKGVSPVLFPAIGVMKNGGATIGGAFYAVPRHGFVRDLPFEVTERGEDFVTLTLEENADTLKVYPFRFALSVTHRFLPNGFETRFTVENHSDRPMPFMLGGHPGFACPTASDEAFEDYVLRFEKPENGDTLLCTREHTLSGAEKAPFEADGRTLPLRYADFDRLDTFIFAGLESRSVELVNPATGHGLRFSFPELPVLAVWTAPGAHAPYVCLEPWQGLPAMDDETGRYEDKPYVLTLPVGRAHTCGYRAELL